ncbi:MAG: hypothetical protein ACK494_05185 [Planctomycetota bacterium]
MNRTDILQCIRKHLVVEAGDPMADRPLGEVVRSIAMELRGDAAIPRELLPPTAIPSVAGFVDGTLSPDDEDKVCRAVLRDNSVLAEIVASVRNPRDRGSLQPLSDDLLGRLMGIAIPSADANPNAIEKPIAVIEPSNSEPDPVRTRDRSSWNATPWFWVAAATAALVLIASQTSFLSRFFSPTNPENTVVKQPDPANDAPGLELPSDPAVGTDGEQPPTIAQQPRTMKDVDANPPAPSGTDLVEATPTIPVPDPNGRGNTPSPKPNDAGKKYPVALGELRWTKIQGVLARRATTSASSLLDGYDRWRGTVLGTTISPVDFESQSLQLCTLPQSRAEGALSAGGKLVVAPDSSMAITQPNQDYGRIRMDRGAIALVDMPPGTAIDLLVEDQSFGNWKWKSAGTLALSIAPNGVLAQIEGLLECDGVEYEDSLLQLGKVVERVGGKSKMPLWVTRNVESLAIPKNILTQLQTSDNVANTLEQVLQGTVPGTDPATWMQLKNWANVSSGRDLVQLFSKGSFAQRAAAIDRLLQLPAWTKMNQRVWQALAANAQNATHVQTLASCAVQLRANQAFSPLQVEALLLILENPDSATRSVADALLRRNFGNGPNYDPTLPQSSSVRAIAIWRRFVASL